ncbi:hypothetical protein ACVDG8_027980 [Mesorhizobium sp. ORM8.1]
MKQIVPGVCGGTCAKAGHGNSAAPTATTVTIKVRAMRAFKSAPSQSRSIVNQRQHDSLEVPGSLL